MYSADAYMEADTIIGQIKSTDYSAGRDEIARVLDEDIWNGNWVAETNFADAGIDLPELLLIQEDEYDQSMSDEEQPAWATRLATSGFGYVFPA